MKQRKVPKHKINAYKRAEECANFRHFYLTCLSDVIWKLGRKKVFDATFCLNLDQMYKASAGRFYSKTNQEWFSHEYMMPWRYYQLNSHLCCKRKWPSDEFAVF